MADRLYSLRFLKPTHDKLPKKATRHKKISRTTLANSPTLFGFNLISFCLLFMQAHFSFATVYPYPPSITKESPTNELLFQVALRPHEYHKPFIIECEAEGNSKPEIIWMKNGNQLNWKVYEGRISQSERGALEVNVPKTEDNGLYQCFATNELGTATSNSVSLRQTELNSFPAKEELLTVVAEEGAPFRLNCTAPHRYPEPEIFWRFENTQGVQINITSPRLTTDPEGTLWFSNVISHDRSSSFVYACVAYSFFRKEYFSGNRIRLETSRSSAKGTKHPPVMLYSSKRNVSALIGNSVTLWCIVGGSPLPEIGWTNKGDSRRSGIEFGNYFKTMSIHSVDFDDEGIYKCDASNGVGSPISYSFYLSVYAAPYFTIEPEIQDVAESESVVLECEAGGKPSPEITWIHNGKPLEKAVVNPRRKLVGNRIIIENAKKADTGNYGCNASNFFGYVYKDVYVNVLDIPAEITASPKDVETTIGKLIILTCRVFGAPKPNVRWYKNDHIALTGGRFTVLHTGDLEIRDAALFDSGEYTCTTYNKFGNDSASGALVVKEHTWIKDKPMDIEVIVGSTAIFRCTAVTDPTLRQMLQIAWLHEDEVIDFDAEQRYAKLQDNSLVIYKTSEHDSGTFTCLVQTEYDKDTASAFLIVNGKDVSNPPELLSVKCFQSDVTIFWKHTGSPIKLYIIEYITGFNPDKWRVADNVAATENSTTVHMSPYANYSFRVIATNEFGQSFPSRHSEVCSTPPDVPFKNPENVNGRGTLLSNFIISWTPMQEIDHNGPNLKYQVEWKLEEDAFSDWEVEEVDDWRKSELIIENLPTFRPYLITVRAINELGESRVAPKVFRGYSGHGEPTESPNNFTIIEKTDARSVLVSWSPVSPTSLRGKFEGYKITTWTDNDEAYPRVFFIKNDVSQVVVDKLIPYTKNYLAVMAYNTDFNGPQSRTIEVVTPQGVPGAVEEFEAQTLSASALLLSWSKPDEPNGVLTGYEIQYQKVIGIELDVLRQHSPIHDSNETRTKIAGLESDTKYRLHIRAKTKAGAGDETFIEVKTGCQVPPEQPKFTLESVDTESGWAAIRLKLRKSGREGSHFYVQYKVVAVDGNLTTTSDEEEIYIYSNGAMVLTSMHWLFGIIVAIAFLLLVFILVCIIKSKRGSKPAIYERKRVRVGREFGEGGFPEYSPPIETSDGTSTEKMVNPPETVMESTEAPQIQRGSLQCQNKTC